MRISLNLFMEFPKAISMQEVLKSGFRHILQMLPHYCNDKAFGIRYKVMKLDKCSGFTLPCIQTIENLQ